MTVVTPLPVLLDVSAVPDRPVGAGHYIVQLARALGERHDVSLVLASRTGDEARWSIASPSADVVGAAPESRPLRLLWERYRLGGLIGRTGVAVHHGPHYTMPRSVPVPSVITVHDLSFFDAPEWHERSKVMLFQRAITTAAHRAAVILCPSRTTAEALARWCTVDATVVVAPHGVDSERFSDQEPSPGADVATLAALDPRLDGRHPMLVFVGTLEPRKDVPTLVRSFAAVADRHPDALLVLAGGRGWGGDAVDAAVVATGVAERVVRTGYVPDDTIPALLRSATAVVYPSLYEGFGLPALEALACGAPLVTTLGTAMAEVAGTAAHLFPPGDGASLTDLLDAVLSGATQANQPEMRATGLDIAGRFTWATSADLHAGAYRSAAEQQQ